MLTFNEIREKTARGVYNTAGLPLSGENEHLTKDIIKLMADDAWRYYCDLREALQVQIGRLTDNEYEKLYDYIQNVHWREGYSGMTNGAEKLAELLSVLGHRAEAKTEINKEAAIICR